MNITIKNKCSPGAHLFLVIGQLRVGHSVSGAEVWHLKKTLLECQNVASLSADSYAAK